MDKVKQARLEAAGFTVGTAAEFLGLTVAENCLVEARLAISKAIRERRLAASMPQTTLAGRMGSSQSRVAKLEAGDPTVSLDLMFRGFFETGASIQDLSEVLAKCEGLGEVAQQGRATVRSGVGMKKTARKRQAPVVA
ncbi:MAG: helix-turn-helix transcriptional regulator [Armatimonadetes bacterium]|nr:helix-turn-helix transcriptional regulator [Armatimonadota bacterium]